MDALNLRAKTQGQLDELGVVSYTPALLRLAFSLPFVAHAAFAIVLAVCLERESFGSGTSYRVAFLPLFIGDALCLTFLLAALAAIYPYVKMLISAGRPRIGGARNPSAFELIGVCIAAAGQLIALGLLFGFHWRLSGALDTNFDAGSSSLLGACSCLIALLILTACYGLLIKDWSGEVLSVCAAATLCLVLLVAHVDHAAQWTSYQLSVCPWMLLVIVAAVALASLSASKWSEWNGAARSATLCLFLYLLCVGAFLCLLYRRLEGGATAYSWTLVFAPLHVAHVMLAFPVGAYALGSWRAPISSAELRRTAAEASALFLPTSQLTRAAAGSISGYTALLDTTDDDPSAQRAPRTKSANSSFSSPRTAGSLNAGSPSAASTSTAAPTSISTSGGYVGIKRASAHVRVASQQPMSPVAALQTSHAIGSMMPASLADSDKLPLLAAAPALFDAVAVARAPSVPVTTAAARVPSTDAHLAAVAGEAGDTAGAPRRTHGAASDL